MTPTRRRRGKVWYKFLAWFLVVSLGPLLGVSYYLIKSTRDKLQTETLGRQEARAASFAAFVSDYITTYRNILFEVAQLSDFAAMSPERQEGTFNRLMQLHPPLLELSLVDMQGRETVRLSRFERKVSQYRELGDSTPFQRALREGEYLGTLERYRGIYPTIVVGLSIVDQGDRRNKGVLLGKINLNGLSQMLAQWFKESSTEGALIGPNGFLVAHSDLDKVFRKDASLPRSILDVILTRPEQRGGGEIEVEGRSYLGAFATVQDLGWVVYVQQPLETAYATAKLMEEQILWSLLFVVLGVLALSLIVSIQLTYPISSLKRAADKLAQGKFDEDIELIDSNDEIGELAHSFKVMWEAIRIKTQEILTAKAEVEDLNRTLENRVDARTRELKAAQEELIAKARLAAIGQMASVVGHEIRNPLAVINNSVYFIKTVLGKAGDLDPKIQKHVSIIESEIKQANSIIDEILTFSRTRELKPALHSINDFLEELLSIYPMPSHVKVVKNLARENPNVFIDPDEMRQAVRNLVGNAVQVMSEGGILRITTELAMGDWVRVDVGDTGSGIPPDVAEKIFTPFYTTKARGTGLGLAVVRKVMDRHKGKVDLETAVGKGTTFKLYLPLASKAAPKDAGARTERIPKSA